MSYRFVFFFFQAEDGIRDLVRSRGLGDVYKRQIQYTARLVPHDGFALAVHSFIKAGGRGVNITVPFKEEAFRLVPYRTPRAELAGAVNTLVVTGSGIVGDNTDGAGLLHDITLNLGYPVDGKRVLLLGAGGAARGVIAPILERQPAGLFIANRTADKAEALARQFSELAAPYGHRLRGAPMKATAGPKTIETKAGRTVNPEK